MSGELVAITSAAAMVAYLGLAMTVRRRSVRARGRSLVRRGGFAAAIPFAVPVPYLFMLVRPGPELPVPEPARWVGLALVLAGIAFAMWAALTLGRHFDLEVEVHAGHQVVTRGPYAIVRHPVYSGLALHLAGAALATGNLLLITGTLAVAWPALYARAGIEERLLRRELGPAYDEYARGVGMLVPFVGLGRR